jgi:F0F1-type ATP synthase assembly protein I
MNAHRWRYIWIVGLTLMVACGLVAPTVFGLMLDRQLGTAPLGMAIGAAIGIIASSVGVALFITRRFHGLAPLKEPDE